MVLTAIHDYNLLSTVQLVKVVANLDLILCLIVTSSLGYVREGGLASQPTSAAVITLLTTNIESNRGNAGSTTTMRLVAVQNK